MGANELRERVSCTYFTRECLHRASLLQCPSHGRELMLMYTKRGGRERICFINKNYHAGD